MGQECPGQCGGELGGDRALSIASDVAGRADGSPWPEPVSHGPTGREPGIIIRATGRAVPLWKLERILETILEHSFHVIGGGAGPRKMNDESKTTGPWVQKQGVAFRSPGLSVLARFTTLLLLGLPERFCSGPWDLPSPSCATAETGWGQGVLRKELP